MAGRLPEFMVPAAVVVLDGLPVTANGKLDTARAAGPAVHRDRWGRGPATAAEEVLCGLFAQVLGVERVGAEDGFFDLGGDSIMSMQLVARARAAGLVFSPRDVFTAQTPAGLAAMAQAAGPAREVAADAGTGEVVLTPVMRRLLERGGPVTEFSQSVLLEVPGGLGVAGCTAALQAVIDHHAMLRARLEDHDGWRLEVQEAGTVTAGELVRRVDISGLDASEVDAAVAAARAAAIGRLAPQAAVMVQAVWLDAGPSSRGCCWWWRTSPGGGRGVMADPGPGPGWRVGGCVRRAPGGPGPGGDVVPPLVAAAGRPGAGPRGGRGAARMAAGRSAAGIRCWAAGRWTRPDTAAAMPADAGAGARRSDRAADGTVPAVFRCGVHEVLLAGLAVAVAEWRARRGQAAAGCWSMSRGHGREQVGRGCGRVADGGLVHQPATRCGWIRGRWRSPRWPAGGAAAGQVLKRVKEQVRAVPGQRPGVRAAALPERRRPPPCWPGTRSRRSGSTTWAGSPRPGSTGPAAGQEPAVWRPAGPDAGWQRRPGRCRPSTCWRSRGWCATCRAGRNCSSSLAWAAQVLDEAEVAELARLWAAALAGLAAHAAQPGAGGLTPSDLPLVSLDQDQIEELEAGTAGGLAEVWPLSPLQEGLLFHALYDADAPDVYMVQHFFDLDGPVDAARLRAAGQALLERHANLRAGFRVLESGQAVQVIPAQVVLPWREVDLSGQADPQAAAEALARQDRERRFDLAAPPLLRFVLARLGSGRWRLVVTGHHLLTDGWSMPVLGRELLALYRAGGDAAALPRVTPYREYLAWLARQDTGAAAAAWAQALAGLEEPTLLAPGTDRAQLTVRPENLVTELPGELTAALEQQARGRAVTVNTVLQAAWGLVAGAADGS